MTGNKSDIEELGRQVGGQNAAAIAKFVDSRIAAAIAGLREEVVGLVGRQKENIEVAKTEGSPEAKASANDATVAVKQADKDVKQAAADPTPEKAAVAEESVEKAKEKVAQTESDLAARVAKHDNELYNEKTGLVGRVKELENARSAQAASIEGLWANVRENAKAITFGTTAGLARIARLSIVAFAVCVLLWLAVVLIFNRVTLGNSWTIGLGLSAIVAGLVYLMTAATLDGFGRRSPASEEADDGLEVIRGGQPPKMTEDEAEASEKVAGRR